MRSIGSIGATRAKSPKTKKTSRTKNGFGGKKMTRTLSGSLRCNSNYDHLSTPESGTG